ncbi:hypothetical protein M407DRAFT_242132 [Tulasnella calospora MUT 4182]|uniref:Uncharacterized protein n=1 Tax=Tulasnella calospora MUT 4182 TaxID=1051891 RepID=A0A0C3MA77_9AGAM|nr:hypothetical protein M407DRAFT_242132 [Tulasnella calospora MUT 4182]
MARGTFIPIFDQLNAVKVKDLTIESGCKHGEELIDYLGKVKEDSQWPLPHLVSLTIGGPSAMVTPLSIALQHRKHDAHTNETPTASRPVTLELLNIEGLRGVEREMEKTLAKYISSSGTFIPASRREDGDSDEDWEESGDDWEESDDDLEESDDNNEDEDMLEIGSMW